MSGKLKLSKMKMNPSNPRVIKDDRFGKLVKSLREFPEMMEKRPMVCVTDSDGKIYPLGGNMRLKALRELGMKEVPEEWVVMADEWSEEKRREFVLKDNVSFGEWDWDVIANEWDDENLIKWGLPVPITLDEIDEMKADEIDEKIGDYTDENCKLPIVPAFHEKHTYFIILTDNEIDEAFIRSKFDLEKKHTSHKSTDDRKSNVIPFKKIQDICLK